MLLIMEGGKVICSHQHVVLLTFPQSLFPSQIGQCIFIPLLKNAILIWNSARITFVLLI